MRRRVPAARPCCPSAGGASGLPPPEPVHVVLVAPEIPQNTGSIGRLCVASGATLHLIEPHRLLGAAGFAAACAAVPPPRHSVYHPSDADLSVTRIVHASLILEMRGTRVVVDPWFESGWMIRQQEPLGLTPDGLPSFAAVLVTHRHHDHFDPRALRRLAATVPEVIARPELHARPAHLGFQRVTDLGWWDRTRAR